MTPPDEVTGHALAVIDQTLAGEPVPAGDADLAELTLWLADERPRRSDAFATALDQREARRFAPGALTESGAAPGHTGSPPQPGGRRPMRARRWLYAPGLAGAVGLAVAALIVIVPGSGGGTSGASSSSSSAVFDASPSIAARSSAAGSSAARSSAGGSSAAGSSAAGSTSASSGAVATGNGSLQGPAPSGRQVIQGAQLELGTRPSRIDDVARQVFAVVSAQRTAQ